MKTRLNLTIHKNLLNRIKTYAAKRNTSVSELVESYFSGIVGHCKRKNIMDLIKELETPEIDFKADLRELYYLQKLKGLKLQ